jgi:hypothetical protein
MSAASCGTAPTGSFGSTDAVNASTCLALAWQPDAVLDNIVSGSTSLDATGKGTFWGVTWFSAHVNSTGTPDPVSGLIPDTEQEWDVGSMAPTAGVMVGAMAGVQKGDPACLVTTPIDDTTVFPSAVATISAMAGFDSKTVFWSASTYNCSSINGKLIGTPGWSVTGAWGPSTAYVTGIVEFDPSGKVVKTTGPCALTDVACIGG